MWLTGENVNRLTTISEVDNRRTAEANRGIMEIRSTARNDAIKEIERLYRTYLPSSIHDCHLDERV